MDFANPTFALLDVTLFIFQKQVFLFDDFAIGTDGFILLLVTGVFLVELIFLIFYFFPQLVDLVVDYFVLPSDLEYFFISFREVLTVLVTITPDCFIEVLLLFQLSLCLDVLLLELTDQVVFQLDFF